MNEHYRIRVKGHLAARWAAAFDGFVLTHAADGSTVLDGVVVDQAGAARRAPPPRRHRRATDLRAARHDTSGGDPIFTAPITRMSPTRKVALAGVAYLVTFAASIPQLLLFANLIDDPVGFLNAGDATPVLWGIWLEIVTAVACVATAVALYPVTRRVSATAAIGFVTSRVVEAMLILIGVVSLLTVVTLKTQFAGAGSVGLVGAALVALRQWTFLVGPGLIPGINALFLGYILYRSLVPRLIPTIGLIGAPLILASATGTLFGAWDQVSALGAVGALPIAVWEFSLGVYLTAKGFRESGRAPLPAARPHAYS